MSSHLGLERDHKKLNENPLLRHSGSMFRLRDILTINRSVSLFLAIITSEEAAALFFPSFLSFCVVFGSLLSRERDYLTRIVLVSMQQDASKLFYFSCYYVIKQLDSISRNPDAENYIQLP